MTAMRLDEEQDDAKTRGGNDGGVFSPYDDVDEETLSRDAPPSSAIAFSAAFHVSAAPWVSSSV